MMHGKMNYSISADNYEIQARKRKENYFHTPREKRPAYSPVVFQLNLRYGKPKIGSEKISLFSAKFELYRALQLTANKTNQTKTKTKIKFSMLLLRHAESTPDLPQSADTEFKQARKWRSNEQTLSCISARIPQINALTTATNSEILPDPRRCGGGPSGSWRRRAPTRASAPASAPRPSPAAAGPP